MENDKTSFQAPWQKEFFKNIEGFINFGLKKEAAKDMLVKFLKLSSVTPQPSVMECFRIDDALDRVGVYTQRLPYIRDFMVEFLEPLMKNFSVEGLKNLDSIAPLLGKYPITLISNHVSHLDAPAIYNLLYREGGSARKLAESLVFIAGRLAFEPDFTRLGLYMFDTLLVCSKRDMSENPGQANLMTKINMRAFRQSQQLQKQGKVIAIFPEGTRSRTGSLTNFVDSVYHYVMNKVVLPISLTGTDEILPTSSFLFRAASGKLTIGRPILVGELPENLQKDFPVDFERMKIPEKADKKIFVVENLALYVGKNLHKHKHGIYRNLYKSTTDKNHNTELIVKMEKPEYKIAVVGNSSPATAYSAILANKNCSLKILIQNPKTAENFNSSRIDLENFPLFYLPPNMEFTADPSVLDDADIIIQGVRPWEMELYYDTLKNHLKNSRALVVNITKGITNSKHGLILDDLEKIYGMNSSRFAVLSGATSAEQIMERKISGFEIAAKNKKDLQTLIKLFSTDYTFVTPAPVTSDIKGVQLGGALKNIYALGIGLLDGYYEKNLGGNSDNSLFHASHYMFKEMRILGSDLGAAKETFSGLSGLTDFMHTCFGQVTRDRNYGKEYAMGTIKEGVQSSGIYGIRNLARLVDFKKYPIAHSIYRITVEKGETEPIMTELYEGMRNLDMHTGGK